MSKLGREVGVNLTRDKKLVEQVSDVNPRRGKWLVIYEVKGDGEKYLDTLSPETDFQPPKPGWLSKWIAQSPSYTAFAVSAEEFIELSFSQRIIMRNQVDSFDLDVRAEFSVLEARKVVDLYKSDPVGQIKRYAAQRLGDFVARQEWELIAGDFDNTVAEDALAQEQGLIEARAKSFGLEIKSIELSRRLPEIYTDLARVKRKVDTDKAKATIETQSEQHKADLEHEAALAQKERERELKEKELHNEISLLESSGILHRENIKRTVEVDGAKALSSGFQRLADNIDSPTTFGNAVGEVMRLFNDGSPGGRGPNALLGATTRAALPASSSASINGLASLLHDVFALVEVIPCPEQEKKKLFSALLHLLAEALLGEDGDGQKIRLCNEEIKANILQFRQHLSMEQFKKLREFFDYEALKAYLQ